MKKIAENSGLISQMCETNTEFASDLIAGGLMLSVSNEIVKHLEDRAITNEDFAEMVPEDFRDKLVGLFLSDSNTTFRTVSKILEVMGLRLGVSLEPAKTDAFYGDPIGRVAEAFRTPIEDLEECGNRPFPDGMICTRPKGHLDNHHAKNPENGGWDFWDKYNYCYGNGSYRSHGDESEDCPQCKAIRERNVIEAPCGLTIGASVTGRGCSCHPNAPRYITGLCPDCGAPLRGHKPCNGTGEHIGTEGHMAKPDSPG